MYHTYRTERTLFANVLRQWQLNEENQVEKDTKEKMIESVE